MIELTKESIIKLWCNHCKTTTDPESFNHFGSSEMPGFGIRINDKVSLTLEGIKETKNYMIDIIFFDVIRYKSFELKEIDYMSLLEYWESGSNRASVALREKLVKEGLDVLFSLI